VTEPDLTQRPPGPLVVTAAGPGPRPDVPAGPQTVQPDVLADREVVDDKRLLVHEQYTGPLGAGRVEQRPGVPGDPNLAGAGWLLAGQEAGEGGLSGAVGATDGEYLAGVAVQVQSGQRPHARVAPADPARREGHGANGRRVPGAE
jgi:hypothetical protein